jgi:hypothetical protein
MNYSELMRAAGHPAVAAFLDGDNPANADLRNTFSTLLRKVVAESGAEEDDDAKSKKAKLY